MSNGNALVVPLSTGDVKMLLQLTDPMLPAFSCNKNPTAEDGPKIAMVFVVVRAREGLGICNK